MGAAVFPLDILGHKWAIRLLPRRRFARRFGEMTLGITDTEKRTIYLIEGYVRFETAAHEITHAYVHEMCLDSTDISASDMEEFFCDLVAKYGGRILLQAHDFVSALDAKS